MKLQTFTFTYAIVIVAATLATALGGGTGRMNDMDVVYEWRTLNFGFPTHADREDALRTNKMIEGNGIPIDVAVQHAADGKSSRIFTTIPRFVEGVAYSLATVTFNRNTHSNETTSLQPYPNYEWHKSHGKDCDGITSAFRTAKTPCNQMWVIDSGLIGGTQHCPPQLLLFDLNTDTLLYRHRFSDDVYTKEASLFITPAVVVEDPPPMGSCLRQRVYVADVSYHGLVVHDYGQRKTWRVENKWMYPDPNFGTHTVAGVSFNLMDGIFGLSCNKDNCYFHPLASNREFAVSRRILDNSTIWENDHEALSEEFRPLGERQSECGAEALDNAGNLYCVQLNPIKILAWHVNAPYKGKSLRVIPANPQLLEFVSGMKVERNAQGIDELWMLSNRFARLAAGTMSPNEVNYRILRRPLDDVQNGVNGFGGNVGGVGGFGGGGGHRPGGGYGSYSGYYGGRSMDLHAGLVFN